MSCKEGGEVSFTHRNAQVEQLAEVIEDLKDKMVEEIGDLEGEIGDLKDKMAEEIVDLKEEIGDLKDQSAQQFSSLKELMEKHIEGK